MKINIGWKYHLMEWKCLFWINVDAVVSLRTF